MPLIYQHRYYRKDLINNPDVLYVFGDNEIRKGFGGQAAEARGEPNAIGIATLNMPGHYWTDDEFEKNVKVLEADFTKVFDALRAGKMVVWPSDGVGTGLAHMASSAPLTFAHLQTLIEKMKQVANPPLPEPGPLPDIARERFEMICDAELAVMSVIDTKSPTRETASLLVMVTRDGDGDVLLQPAAQIFTSEADYMERFYPGKDAQAVTISGSDTLQ
ncbi:hypothetical protein CPT_Seuss109 [Caulobacter phage Seuss]|uniref:DUF7831 domain-containing protein n=1 Tax=Caulobacter phage Seuss TaxID=1675601 RepID=A0A0K1LNB8_9CAUD|nr:hypothetical protein HOR08_gp109 [Caulobacter phage Seuss]AKU43635.1 hypothetical protein CPT_Seuss109 [Caulobacter phage Seuss]